MLKVNWNNMYKHACIPRNKKITLANVLPSKFCTMCFTQSSVSSGTVARLLEYRDILQQWKVVRTRSQMFADVKNYIPQSNTCKICIICIPLPKDFDCSGCPSLVPVRMNYQLFMEYSSEKNTQTSYV